MGRLNDDPLPIYVGQSFISPILGGCRCELPFGNSNYALGDLQYDISKSVISDQVLLGYTGV